MTGMRGQRGRGNAAREECCDHGCGAGAVAEVPGLFSGLDCDCDRGEYPGRGRGRGWVKDSCHGFVLGLVCCDRGAGDWSAPCRPGGLRYLVAVRAEAVAWASLGYCSSAMAKALVESDGLLDFAAARPQTSATGRG